MFVYILRRLSQTALVLAITSLLVFGGLYLVGDPVALRDRRGRTTPLPGAGWDHLRGGGA